MTSRYLRSKRVKEILHFSSTLSLRHLVAGPEGWCTAVWRGCIRRVGFTGKASNLLMLKRVMMGTGNFYFFKKKQRASAFHNSFFRVQKGRGTAFLPSSSRCWPGGRRESLVNMLLVIDVWSLFRRESIVDVDRGSSLLPLERWDISGSGNA